jgi:hypothetical protein
VDMILTIKDDQIEFSRFVLSPDGKYVVAKSRSGKLLSLGNRL